jgi:hypothetical protein
MNLYAPTAQWQAKVGITGLDPNKKYYLQVYSLDGKVVTIDGYRATPYQEQQSAAASSEDGEGSDKKKGGRPEPPSKLQD